MFWTAPATLVLRDYGVEPFRIKGNSMQPVLNGDPMRWSDDTVLVQKGWYKPKRGDVVIVKSPESPDESLAKRLVGLPGDTVVRRGRAGEEQERRFERVPKGKCWIEGDNGKTSKDSNSYGAVPLALVKGRVMCVCWPPGRFGVTIERKESDRVRFF